ncbi:MAG: hypothetical protein IT350_20575 [Deltaproteobacteria bacterium]|nr:hypothetical protein [Deltaproteobacteria bacterium]
MIPVRRRPEPASFDAMVRQPGSAWLRSVGISPTDWKPGSRIWRKCLDDLHREYAGVCAYLCIFIEPVTGAKSVDHFVPKSIDPNLAFEWSNYRLACMTMNGRKSKRSVPLDPFRLRRETFHLELVTGRIYPNPDRSMILRRKAQAMIDLLGLDDGECRAIRAAWWNRYILCFSCPSGSTYLRDSAPFVYSEAKRQGML